MKTIYFNENTIVAFHVGRGGHFNNAGHVSFIGEHKIGDFTDNLIFPDNDDPESEYQDQGGNSVLLTNAMVESGIGVIDEDGEYDKTYTMYIKDVDEDSDEWKAIFAANDYDAEQAQMFLRKELAIDSVYELAGYINKCEDWDLAVGEIIERNCWDDLTGDGCDVCEDNDWHRVTLNENGEAIVVDAE